MASRSHPRVTDPVCVFPQFAGLLSVQELACRAGGDDILPSTEDDDARNSAVGGDGLVRLGGIVRCDVELDA